MTLKMLMSAVDDVETKVREARYMKVSINESAAVVDARHQEADGPKSAGGIIPCCSATMARRRAEALGHRCGLLLNGSHFAPGKVEIIDVLHLLEGFGVFDDKPSEQRDTSVDHSEGHT